MGEVQCINDNVHRECGTSRRGQEDDNQQQGDIRPDIHKEKIRVNILNSAMGVPITFLNKYCPNQFEVIGMSSSAGYNKEIVGLDLLQEGDARPLLNNKNTYARIFIRRKLQEESNEN